MIAGSVEVSIFWTCLGLPLGADEVERQLGVVAESISRPPSYFILG